MALTLMYITNNPNIAKIAEKNGVDRIWIDLETRGKELRQKGFDSVKNCHSIDDIKVIKPFISKSELMVRVNSWNSDSPKEINDVIEAGAQRVMLPMWEKTEEVREFLNITRGKVKTTLLLETIGAEKCLDDVLKIDGIDEIHIGLNDLHIQYGLKFMFELLANGKVDYLCGKIRSSGIPYGFGGIARLGGGAVPSELIIPEHYRLGSSMTILSRSFYDTKKNDNLAEAERVFAVETQKIRDYEKKILRYTEKDFSENREKFLGCVSDTVKKMTGVAEQMNISKEREWFNERE